MCKPKFCVCLVCAGMPPDVPSTRVTRAFRAPRARPRKGAAVAAAKASAAAAAVVTTASRAPGATPNVVPHPSRARPPDGQSVYSWTPYTPERPLIRELHLDKLPPRFKCRKIIPHPPKFRFPRPQPNFDSVEEVTLALNRMYIPDDLVLECAQHTREYIETKRIPQNKRWKIGAADIFQFFAIFQYMGYCRLPATADYWRPSDDVRGTHPICTARGFTLKKWQFMFNNIYFVEPEPDDLEPEETEDSDDDDDDSMPDFVPLSDTDDESDSESDDESDSESDADDDDSDSESDEDEDDPYVFEPKVRPLYDAFNKANHCLCVRPGTYVTIDEMMARFKGRSRETYRMRGKPIREGYKFFSLCDAQSKFIWRMFPYGRVSHKHGIIKTVVDLVTSLPDRGVKQYVCAMDNYFTWDGAINKCVDAHVHVCGTAKGKRNWPPAVIKRQTDDRFNSLHHITAKSGKYKIYRWIDNNVVWMVSSYHDPQSTRTTERKRPRINNTNKSHVQKVWGDQHTVSIEIPGCVQTYNDYKVGVDGADQLIASYTPKMRFRRIWMPQMAHAYNAIRVNSYIVHKYLCDHPTSAKEYTLGWIRAFMKRARMCARSARRAMTASSTGPRLARQRLSSRNPTLPPSRFNSQLSHVSIQTTKQGKCLMCRYRYLCKKIEHPEEESEWGVIGRPRRKCLGCDVHLCVGCFDPYHDINTN